MLSFHYLRFLADERERELQEELRTRRLLRGDGSPASAQIEDATARYRTSLRARTPRARATTR